MHTFPHESAYVHSSQVCEHVYLHIRIHTQVLYTSTSVPAYSQTGVTTPTPVRAYMRTDVHTNIHTDTHILTPTHSYPRRHTHVSEYSNKRRRWARERRGYGGSRASRSQKASEEQHKKTSAKLQLDLDPACSVFSPKRMRSQSWAEILNTASSSKAPSRRSCGRTIEKQREKKTRQ